MEVKVPQGLVIAYFAGAEKCDEMAAGPLERPEE